MERVQAGDVRERERERERAPDVVVHWRRETFHHRHVSNGPNQVPSLPADGKEASSALAFYKSNALRIKARQRGAVCNQHHPCRVDTIKTHKRDRRGR